VSYGKSIHRRGAADFLRHYRDNSVRIKDAAGMTDDELAGRIVVGELLDIERPEFASALRAVNERVRQEAAK
jgi:2-oxoglutarate ferredoxin oxidoreductase subunit beta